MFAIPGYWRSASGTGSRNGVKPFPYVILRVSIHAAAQHP
jgi:hypothetical protein